MGVGLNELLANKGTNMDASTPEIAAMKDRIHNLELALHGMWSLLRELQPPATQIDVDNMLSQHFDMSRAAGGFEYTHFVG